MSKKKSIAIGILGIFLCASIAGGLYEKMEYDNLQSKYGLLSEEHESLKSNYSELQSGYSELQSDYDSLQSDYTNLQGQYSNLQSDYDSLESDYDSLQSNHASLQSNYNSLDNVFDAYKRIVEVRYGRGNDCLKFITPNEPSVISKTSEILGHSSDGELSWDDMFDINSWIGNNDNIDYNIDTFNGGNQECWLYPKETLEFGAGDCEDQSLLMASMCNAEGDASWLWVAEIMMVGKGGHVCIFLNVENDMLYIFDPTKGWHSLASVPESLALTEYAFWSGVNEILVKRIFNDYHDVHSFSNNQEFYDFF